MAHGLPIHRTRMFTWVAESNCFVCEASDLPRPMARRSPGILEHIGFMLRDNRFKQRDVLMLLDGEHRDNEGELMYWEFKPADKSYSVRIYND